MHLEQDGQTPTEDTILRSTNYNHTRLYLKQVRPMMATERFLDVADIGNCIRRCQNEEGMYFHIYNEEKRNIVV
jgi:hypothetical protein